MNTLASGCAVAAEGAGKSLVRFRIAPRAPARTPQRSRGVTARPKENIQFISKISVLKRSILHPRTGLALYWPADRVGVCRPELHRLPTESTKHIDKSLILFQDAHVSAGLQDKELRSWDLGGNGNFATGVLAAAKRALLRLLSLIRALVSRIDLAGNRP